MKIVFFNDLIYRYATGASSVFGGAERQQWFLARGLAAVGSDVIIGVRSGLAPGCTNAIGGVKFVGLHGGQIFRSWYRLLMAERPDWWYWRCASHLLGPAVTIAKLAGVRTIFSTGFDRDLQPRHALYRRPGLWRLYQYGLSRADKIFVQHGDQFAALPSRWQKKASVVPSIAEPEPEVKDHSERENYVAWVAMLREFKRPDLLIEVARKAPAIRFIVGGGMTTFMSPAGYGEQVVDALRALPNVDYRGQVSPSEALRIITDAALFLSTADEEGFPNTFLQAWCGGTPVISLGIDPGGVIERHGLGLVAANVESAVAAIRSLVTSLQRRQAVGARARQYIAENHSETAVINAFERAIQLDPHGWPESISRSTEAAPAEGKYLHEFQTRERRQPGHEPLA
jgi:glycosyltransferase involved in cell wall biosynthesis